MGSAKSTLFITVNQSSVFVKDVSPGGTGSSSDNWVVFFSGTTNFPDGSTFWIYIGGIQVEFTEACLAGVFQGASQLNALSLQAGKAYELYCEGEHIKSNVVTFIPPVSLLGSIKVH